MSLPIKKKNQIYKRFTYEEVPIVISQEHSNQFLRQFRKHTCVTL